MGGKAKHLVLLGPCGGQVGEAGNAHAMRKSTFNRRFDEIGREERKRDRHIDLAHAAFLACCDMLYVGYRARDELIEPTTAACDCVDQSHPPLDPSRTNFVLMNTVGYKDLP